MSSYYGGEWVWEAFRVEVNDGEPQSEVQESSGVWSGYETSGSWAGNSARGWRAATGERAQHEDDAERYELTSNASSHDSWWKNDAWSWDSWDGSSCSGRSNWVYVSRREDRGNGRQGDPWHWWHGSDSDYARQVRPGELGRDAFRREDDSGQCAHAGDSGGEDRRDGGLPSGQVLSVCEKADKEEEKKSQGKPSNSYPPVFRARQGESYKEWKRSVKFWLCGEGQQLPSGLVGPRVMVQLRDRAAALVKHLEPEDVSGKNGLEVIFSALERSPLIRQSEKNKVDWHRKRLLNLTRLAGESMESYITRASLYRDQLQGLDAALNMGERFYVGHLMDHARLTRRDKAMVKTHAGDESELNITEALIELSAELEGESGYPIGQSETHLSHTQGEEHLVQRGFVGSRFARKDKSAFVADLQDEVCTQVSMEGIPEEVPGEESLDEAELPSDVLHAEHEALALQYKAKQKMAEVKKMRQYFRKGEDSHKAKTGKCFVCDEVGHFARDCPKVKAANALDKGNQVLLTSTPTLSDQNDANTEWDLLATLCKDTIAASSSENAAYMVLGTVELDHVENQNQVNIAPFEAWWNMKELSRKVILDLGCMRNVVGVQWANDVVTEWKKQGRWLKVLSENEVFRFGNGTTLTSKYRLQLEATFGGKRILLALSVVPGPCPPLLSKQSHTLLGVQIDTEHHTMSSRKLGIQKYGLSENGAGHYTVRIDEFHLVSSLDDVQDLRMDISAEVAMFVKSACKSATFGSPGERGEPQSPTSVNVSQPERMSDLPPDGSSHVAMPGDVRGRGCLSSSGCDAGAVGSSQDARGRVGGSPSPGAREEPEGGSETHGCGPQGSRKRTLGESSGLDAISAGDAISAEAFDSSTIAPPARDLRPRRCGLWGDRDGNDPGREGDRLDCGGDPNDPQAAREEEGCDGPQSSNCGADGMGGQLSILEQCVERRLGVQHHGQHPQPHQDLPMEETGVATSCERGGEDRVQGEGRMEAQPEVAQLPDQLRDCGTMGTLRSDAPTPAQLGLHSQVPWQKLSPQRGLMQKLKQGMEKARDKHICVTEIRRMDGDYLLMEIFAGCARLTQMARARDGWKTLEPVDLHFGQDLNNSATRMEVLDKIRRLKPDLVTMSPRCGPWSQFQRINPNVDKVMADRQADLPLWRFCRVVWDEQTKEGRLALIENPAQSEAFNVDFMKARPQLFRAKIPQCAFGLKDVVSGKPHQKYTFLDVNDPYMCEALLRGAVCTHEPEEHQPIEGCVMYEGRSQKRSALAARWPPELCDHILQAAEAAWEKCDETAPQDLSEGREPGSLHYAMPVEPLPSPEGELRQQLAKADWRGGQYDYVYFEGTSRQGPYKIRQALAHLHVVLGHPSADRLKRMLQISGCSSSVLQTADGLRCQICQAVRPLLEQNPRFQAKDLRASARRSSQIRSMCGTSKERGSTSPM